MIVKRGILMEDVKNCKSLLITIGWINALFAFVFFQLFCGIIAVCMGIVLKIDYHADKYGLTLIIVGIIGGIAGWILNYLYF
jgi:ABC-type antimicrobial peptide transport system permease subunit